MQEKVSFDFIEVFWDTYEMNLDKQVQVRMPKEMHEFLLQKAKERGPGLKVTDLIREAIHQVYFSSKAGEKKSPSKKTK